MTGAARGALIRLAVSIAVLVGLTIAVSGQTILRGEVAVVELLNDVPTTAGWPLRVVMQLGTLAVALVVVAVVAWWTRARGPGPTLAVLLAVAVASRADNVLKDIIDRPRPSVVLEGLHVRETIGGFGFPSGHTTMAFAIAASLPPTVPRPWRWGAWALACIVGIARMHVGVHWPADVIGGAALGTAIGTSALLLSALRRGPPRAGGRVAGRDHVA